MLRVLMNVLELENPDERAALFLLEEGLAATTGRPTRLNANPLLRIAASRCQARLLQPLVEARAELDAPDPRFGSTALDRAVSAGPCARVKCAASISTNPRPAVLRERRNSWRWGLIPMLVMAASICWSMPALKWRCCFAGTKPGLLFPKKQPSGVGGRHLRSRHGLGAVAWEGQFDRCGSRREAPPPMGRDAAAVRPSSSRYEHRVRITALLFILAPINQTFFLEANKPNETRTDTALPGEYTRL
eukprot:s373_g18.t2